VSVLGTYPVAALCALVFRFPIPLGGYVGGLTGAALTPLAVTVYGAVFAGFVIQGVLGAVAGGLAARRAKGNQRQAWRLTLAYGVGASVPGVAVLALLDKIIGPW
jgi:hypothetical protein